MTTAVRGAWLRSASEEEAYEGRGRGEDVQVLLQKQFGQFFDALFMRPMSACLPVNSTGFFALPLAAHYLGTAHHSWKKGEKEFQDI